MARRSDKKSPKGTTDISRADVSRRTFIERIVGGGVAAPALVSLTGAWLATETTAFAQASSASSSSGRPSQSAPPPSASSGSSRPLPSQSSPASQSSQTSASGASHSAPWYGTLLYADADATLRKDAPNVNEGANPRIRVSASPVRRGVVAFSPDAVAMWSAQAQGGASVYLRLFIAENNNNWGQSEDHQVDVRALPPNFYFPEGNGAITGLPAALAGRGAGAGVTWNSANDPNIADNKKSLSKHDANRWEGASRYMRRATAPGQVHINQQTGAVEWDVTLDVIDGVSAWVITVDNDHGRGHDTDHGHDDDHGHQGESESAGDEWSRRAGGDPFAGAVDYYSKEGAGFNLALAPQLELVYGGGGGESSSEAVGSESA